VAKAKASRGKAAEDFAEGLSARIHAPPDAVSARWRIKKSRGGERLLVAPKTTSDTAKRPRYWPDASYCGGDRGSGRYDLHVIGVAY
jgi:hypothetical protein